MSHLLQLLLLGCACSLAAAARELKVACSENVDLPCTAPWNPRVPYRVSWTKQLTEGGEKTIEVPQEDLQTYHQTEQKGLLEAPSQGPYSLKIHNATSCSSGTYRCTLEGPGGQRNQSGTVTLKVTGCHKERREETFKKYRAEIVLLLVLVVFYITLIVFTCKFAQQTVFPEFSKPGMERAFFLVTSPRKPAELVTLPKTELV